MVISMELKKGDFVRIKNLPTHMYPIAEMKNHAGKLGRIITIHNDNRAILCLNTGFRWLLELLEKV